MQRHQQLTTHNSVMLVLCCYAASYCLFVGSNVVLVDAAVTLLTLKSQPHYLRYCTLHLVIHSWSYSCSLWTSNKNTLLHISHIINFCCCCYFCLFVCLFVVVVAEYNTLAEQCYGTYMDTVRRWSILLYSTCSGEWVSEWVSSVICVSCWSTSQL